MSEERKKKENSWIVDLFFRVYNDNKRKRYAKENQKIQGHPVVFFGDSITDNCDLEKYYPGIYAFNREISGNTTEDLLKRMKVSVYDAHPSKVVLLIGINDMMNEGYRPKAVQAATVTVPKELMQDWRTMLETVYMLDWTPAGRPMRTMAASLSLWKRISLGTTE